MACQEHSSSCVSPAVQGGIASNDFHVWAPEPPIKSGCRFKLRWGDPLDDQEIQFVSQIIGNGHVFLDMSPEGVMYWLEVTGTIPSPWISSWNSRVHASLKHPPAPQSLHKHHRYQHIPGKRNTRAHVHTRPARPPARPHARIHGHCEAFARCLWQCFIHITRCCCKDSAYGNNGGVLHTGSTGAK